MVGLRKKGFTNQGDSVTNSNNIQKKSLYVSDDQNNNMVKPRTNSFLDLSLRNNFKRKRRAMARKAHLHMDNPSSTSSFLEMKSKIYP